MPKVGDEVVLNMSFAVLLWAKMENMLCTSRKGRSMSEKYYSDVVLDGGETFYVFMDTTKPFDKMLRWTKEAPQHDGKMTEPYYLDPAIFWDKVGERYIDTR